MGQEVSRQGSAQHQTLPLRHKKQISPVSETTEQLLARFPQQHSCQHCIEDVINAFNPKAAYPLTFLRSRDGAIEAAKNGCKLFEWLLLFFVRSQAPANHGFYLQRTSLKELHDISSVQFLIGTPQYTWPCADFEVFAESSNAASSYISTRPFNADVASSASFDIAKNWLTECHRSHECHLPGAHLRPTRLLLLKGYIGIVSIQDMIESSIEDVKYATVSYCWGGDQTITTTKATLSQHKMSIKISSLGQTLQDAIEVARSLDIPYLWVDSLCIIQDDAQDMAREISRMSEYYEHGYVSICASVASRSNQGFLRPRTNSPYLYGPFELPYRGSDNNSGSVKLAQYHKYSKNMEPVTARAWIMQESLLAPRILSYSYQSIAWSCRMVNLSDGGPSREWYDFEDRKTWAKLQDEKDLEVCIWKWNGLVQSYTSRNLSESKDKLPAISGIAQKYVKLLEKHLPNDWEPQKTAYARHHGKDVECLDYVAGLWYIVLRPGSLPVMFTQQLLWSTSYYKTDNQSTYQEPGTIARAFIRTNLDATRASPASTPPTTVSRLLISRSNHTYLAPSWSWASVEGPISYERVFGDFPQASDLSIVSCETQLELSEAPYGNVLSGGLTIGGLLIPMPQSILSAPFRERWIVVHRPDTKESAAVLFKVMEGKREGWVLQLTDEARETSTKPKDPSWHDSAPKGLVIVSEGKNYRRVGLCSIERHPGVREYSKFGDVENLLESYGKVKRITII